MSKIAIDVVLLPPDNIVDVCIFLNKQDPNPFSVLNKIDNFSHITLFMGIADEDQLLEIEKILKNIANDFNPLVLEIIDMYVEVTPDGRHSQELVISPTSELVRLHSILMNRLSQFLSEEVDIGMFYKDSEEKLHEASVFWVKNFKKNNLNPIKFSPHISLKCGRAQYDNYPIEFKVVRLALCRLGDYCTCRKILKEVELR